MKTLLLATLAALAAAPARAADPPDFGPVPPTASLGPATAPSQAAELAELLAIARQMNTQLESMNARLDAHEQRLADLEEGAKNPPEATISDDLDTRLSRIESAIDDLRSRPNLPAARTETAPEFISIQSSGSSGCGSSGGCGTSSSSFAQPTIRRAPIRLFRGGGGGGGGS